MRINPKVNIWLPLSASAGLLAGAILLLILLSPSHEKSEKLIATNGLSIAAHSKKTKVPERSFRPRQSNHAQPIRKSITPDHSSLKASSDSLRTWLAAWIKLPTSERSPQHETKGLRLAKERAVYLKNLMRLDPEAALEQSLRWDEWEALPASIKEVSERPFSEWTSQEANVACNQNQGTTEHELWIELQDKDYVQAWSFERKARPLSREGISTQGFIIESGAAVRPSPSQLIDPRELSTVEKLFPRVGGAKAISDWSGEPLNSEGNVVLLMGGKLVQLANHSELEAMTETIEAWENRPDPSGGVSELSAWLEQSDPDKFIPLSEALEAPPVINNWTETPKRLLMMMADFDDLTGEREDYTTLSNKLTNDISPLIDEMSFGKTNLIVTVVPDVIRMPELSTYYPAEKAAGRNANGQLHDHARAGAEAQGYVLDDYDFWCVQFKSIGMGYGGLANVGGKKSWIQSSGTGVFVHEYGHNYGVGHASRWIPDSGEPAFTTLGTTQEYGGGSSIMGGGPFPEGHFDSQAKVQLNWLNTDQWMDVTASGRYRLYRADHPDAPADAKVGALRIDRPDDTGDAIWLGYKRTIDWRRRLSRGVQVLWQKAEKPKKNWLIKAGREGSFPADDYELPIGQTFSDALATDAIHITPVARGGADPHRWIDLQINLGIDASNFPPTASWTTLHSSISPYQTVKFSVNGSDPNDDELSYHWDMGDASEVSVNAPSIIHTYTLGGTYQLNVEISDMKGGKVNLSGTVTVEGNFNNWTKRISGSTSRLYSIASNDTRAIAVSNSGEAVTSPDGISWSRVNIRTQQGSNGMDFREVLNSGSSFLIVGQERINSGDSWQGCIYRSVDGINWTRVYLGGSRLNRLVHDNGTWLATGDNSTVLSSTDGQSWNSVTFPTSDHVQAAAYGNGRWFLMADRNNQRTWAFTSPDLQTWTEQTWASTFGNNKIARPLRWLDGEFFFGGFALGLRSVDATGQTLNPTPELDGMNVYDMIEYNGQIFATGDITENSIRTGHVHLRDHGGIWSRITFPQSDRMRSLTAFKNRLIVVGDSGEIWHSGSLNTPQPTGWYLWQTQNAGGTGVDDDPYLDPSGNSLPNAIHYALGNPVGGGSTPNLPHMSVGTDGDVRFKIPRDGIRDDVVYRILHSTDLINWSQAGLDITLDSAELLEARLTNPPEALPHFFRLEVELAP